jgi:aspartokinase
MLKTKLVSADVTTILSRAGISIDAIMQQSRLKTLFQS